MKGFFLRYTKFLPGLIILVVGMAALNASVKLSEGHRHLEEHYAVLTSQYTSLVGTQNVAENKRIEVLNHKIKDYETWLYWIVITISLTAFLLLILNADKMRKMEALHAERRQALKLLEQRLAAIEASVEGIGIIDAHENLTYMNPALMELHGIAPDRKDRYIGKPWLNLYPPKGQAYVKENVLPEFERKGFWCGQSKILRMDDRVITAELSLTRLKDGGFIGTARDITDQEKIAAEKKQMQEQLAQAQKMEAIGRLAGGIAHDFNNIIAAINGYAEFLKEDLEDGSATQKFATNIMQAGRQATALVDKILTFSRRHDNVFETMDVSIPLHETLSMLEATLPKTIELHTDIQLPNAKIEGNTTQISQMIMNLCVNARDAMETDKGSIHVTLAPYMPAQEAPFEMLSEKLPDPQGSPWTKIFEGEKEGQTILQMGTIARDHEYVRLSVADTGSGISLPVMEHVFEPFFTTKDVHKGTGLGLAAVHGSVTAHRGALIINSVLGHGTRFDLLFPLSTADVNEDEFDASVELPPGHGVILLVEDQEDVRDMTATMLERLGYDVVAAENGMDALDELRENPDKFSLVLTDQNMPKMTGVELVTEAQYDFPDMPFVLLSGYSESKLQELMLENTSVKAVIRKPVSQKALGLHLAKILGLLDDRHSEVA